MSLEVFGISERTHPRTLRRSLGGQMVSHRASLSQTYDSGVGVVVRP